VQGIDFVAHRRGCRGESSIGNGAGMTRRKNDPPPPPGGRAAERLREFERARGLGQEPDPGKAAEAEKVGENKQDDAAKLGDKREKPPKP